MSTAGVGETPSRRTKRVALIAAILGSGIVFLDGTIVNVALPAIRMSLHGTLADQQWIVEAYLLTLSSLLLIGGSLGDLFGRRRLFRIGLVWFGACSLLCAIAPSSGVLIVARAAQGVGGAMLVPSTLALLIDTFEGEERGAAIGSWTAWTGIVTVIGPLGGGVLVQLASWRWIFAVNLLPVLATLALLRELPPDTRTTGHVDVVGAILCALGLGGPVFALIEQPQYGWANARVAIPLVVGVVLFAAFIAWERRSSHPMMPLELFAVRNFSVGNITTFALYGGLNIALFFIVLFIQQVGHYTPIEAGLALLPVTILIFTLSRRFGALSDRIGPHIFLGAGPLTSGVGLGLLVRVGPSANYLTEILPGVALFALGMSATIAPLTSTVLGSVEAGHSGLASGVNNAVARVAGLIAIAAVGAIVAGSFDGRLNADLSGVRLSQRAHAALVVARRRPLVTNASAVPAPERATVHAALVNASVHAFRVGMLIASALALLGGLVAVVGIENPKRRVSSAKCAGGALAGSSPDVAVPAPAPGPAAGAVSAN